jgi:Leucine-rich repeat (LRR) protein
LSQENKHYGETKNMTREEAVRRIDRAAEEKLTQLDLSGLGLEELPPEIGKCTQLEMLVLGGKLDEEKRNWLGNKLTEFPDVVLQLTNLKILNLSGNQITAIPEANRATVESDKA